MTSPEPLVDTRTLTCLILCDWLLCHMICRSEASCVQIMAPFLWYLYCEPSQLQEYANLRLALLKVLLQPRDLRDKEQPSTLEQQILQLCCDMVPCLQVRPLLPTSEHGHVLIGFATCKVEPL